MKTDKTQFELVRDFHNKFGGTYDGTPRFFQPDEQEFRIKCLREELLEYEEAVEEDDLEERSEERRVGKEGRGRWTREQ